MRLPQDLGRLLLWLALTAFAPPLALKAQAAPSSTQGTGLDPAVTYVVTEGYWEQSGHSGHYRAVVVSGGFEHVVSALYLEWVEDPSSEDAEARVVAGGQVKAIPDGAWSLGRPAFTLRGGRWYLDVAGANTHTKHRWRYVLGPPGEAAEVTISK